MLPPARDLAVKTVSIKLLVIDSKDSLIQKSLFGPLCDTIYTLKICWSATPDQSLIGLLLKSTEYLWYLGKSQMLPLVNSHSIFQKITHSGVVQFEILLTGRNFPDPHFNLKSWLLHYSMTPTPKMGKDTWNNETNSICEGLWYLFQSSPMITSLLKALYCVHIVTVTPQGPV